MNEIFNGDMPDKKYNTIMIDPPWPISLSSKSFRGTSKHKMPYKTMSLEDIRALPIEDITVDGAHVYTWTTNKFLEETFDVIRDWGVNYHLTMVWTKPQGLAPSMGYQFATEFCLLGFRGKPMQKFEKMGKSNWLHAASRKHSTKPEAFKELVEVVSPSPRLEMFARAGREGWDSWGDEL